MINKLAYGSGLHGTDFDPPARRQKKITVLQLVIVSPIQTLIRTVESV